MSNRAIRRHAEWIVVLALAGGCNVQPGPPAAVPTVPVPTLTPVNGTSPTQDRGGLTVSVVPAPYTLVQQDVVTLDQVGEATRTTYPDGAVAVQTPVRTMRRTRTPTAVPTPDRVAFTVTIVNRLPHVFRGQGMLAQFVTGGQPAAAGDAGELTAAVVPPGGQQQVMVYGPPLSSIAVGTTVGLTLYDMVTATDAAGNATERQTMTWSYAYGVQNQPMPNIGGPVTEDYDEPIGPSIVVVPGDDRRGRPHGNDRDDDYRRGNNPGNRNGGNNGSNGVVKRPAKPNTTPPPTTRRRPA